MHVYPERDATATPVNPAHFTGGVWRTEHLPAQGPDRLVGNRFLYEPGSRSHWHLHDGDQAIVVTAGRGLVSWEGLDEPVVVLPGDWLHVEPGVEHWHGAAPDSVFVHLAVTAPGATHWLRPVDDADYVQGSAPDA